MRWMWIDRIVELIPRERMVAIKNVSLAEEHLHDHFAAQPSSGGAMAPALPIMPASLIIEGMAQTAGALCVYSRGQSDTPKLVYFMTIDKVKFRKPVLPGDQLRYQMTKIRNRTNIWKFEGIATVDGVKVAEAEISAMLVDH